MGRPLFWVIGGGLLQVPLIEEVRKLNLDVIVSDQNSDCVCRQLADLFIEIDIFDIEGHIREADKITASNREIVGVLAAGIDAPETMAALCDLLKLKCVDRDVAHLVHHKNLFRERLKQLGYPVPRFVTVTSQDLDRVGELVDKIGLPLIVKNSDSSGSRGTKIFYKDDIDGITAVLKEAMHVSKSGIALIEECWQGPEQTVETLFDINGYFHPCFITDRAFDRSNGYAMELGLRNPSNLPIDIQNEMFALAEGVARDFGIEVGAAKYDMILTDHGPRIIEMTVRLSGGFDCQYLSPAATGKNVLKAAVLTALGQGFSPDLLKNVKNRVGLTASLWPSPGQILSISGVEEALSINGVEHIFFRYNIGDVIDPYTDCTKRVCFIIVTGKDQVEAEMIMEKVRMTVKIETKQI